MHELREQKLLISMGEKEIKCCAMLSNWWFTPLLCISNVFKSVLFEYHRLQMELMGNNFTSIVDSMISDETWNLVEEHVVFLIF